MASTTGRAPLQAAVRTAEHVLATAADEVERRYPDDPYAQRVAEVGMLSGALRALLEAVRPTLEQAS